ncbi:hypothetical protein [Catenulispora subtropica]|uniref:C2H2-type domain-containing protein n=1 Tax=Catenulispora subtropica TaxID=450798 RepID=A0ABP5C8G5_9ACTN
MIQITLGKQRSVDPLRDDLKRSRVGWAEDMSREELFNVARGVWSMSGRRVERERYAVVSGDTVIRMAIEIDGIVPCSGGRRAFTGRPLEPGHPVYDLYVGKPAPNGAQQNPITYFDSVLDNRVCNCGCGQAINRGDFLPGHDQRAIHERISKVGSVKDFLAWFDATWDTRLPVETTDK